MVSDHDDDGDDDDDEDDYEWWLIWMMTDIEESSKAGTSVTVGQSEKNKIHGIYLD